MAGVLTSGMMTGMVLEGVNIVNKHTSHSVSSFSLESSEWAKMNLDTRAVADTFPSNFAPEGMGDGSFYDWIPDGEAWQFQGYDENGFPRSLDGRLSGCIRSVEQQRISNFCISTSISRVAGQRSLAKKNEDFCVKHNGGLHDSDSQQNWSGNDNSCMRNCWMNMEGTISFQIVSRMILPIST